MGKDAQVVTAVGIDSNGNVWTGHQKVGTHKHRVDQNHICTVYKRY